MSQQIISFDAWLGTPTGQYLLDWERQRMDKAVEDIFGYNALQLGLPAFDSLAGSRITNRWLACEDTDAMPGAASSGSSVPEATTLQRQPTLVCRFDALPFPTQSIDLVVLPHTLNLVSDPHATLREVQRVLLPDGRVVITGFNPASLWGLKQRRTRFFQQLGCSKIFLPLGAGSFIGYWRLRDWLRLLSLDIVAGHFGCYRPAFKTPRWLARTAWMEPAGDRWWPILGAAFELTAVKRVRGMHLIGAPWKDARQKKTHGAVVVSKLNRTMMPAKETMSAPPDKPTGQKPNAPTSGGTQ